MKWIASVYVYRCARSDSDRNADEMENVKTTNEITLGFRMKYRCSGIYPSLIRIKKKQKTWHYFLAYFRMLSRSNTPIRR